MDDQVIISNLLTCWLSFGLEGLFVQMLIMVIGPEPSYSYLGHTDDRADSNHFGRLMSFSRRRVVYAKRSRRRTGNDELLRCLDIPL